MQPISLPDNNAGSHVPFVNALQIVHGPVDILGPFFLEAHTAALSAGVLLTFGTFEELIRVNAANRDNWVQALPLFDPKNGLVTPERSACVFGRNAAGEVVAVHAVHFFDWPDTTFAREAEALRVHYADPDRMRLSGERCVVTSPSAHAVSGRVIYSGAAWCRPDYRGRGLSRILPRVAKAYALTRWNPAFVVSYMTPATHARGLADRVGYTVIDWAIELYGSFLGDFKFYFLSMSQPDIISYVASFADGRTTAQVDAGIVKRGA